MHTITSMVAAIVAILLSVPGTVANLPHAPYWHLAKVIDERTLELRSDEGETQTITLACVGRAKDNRAALAYITKRLRDQDLAFWHLQTGRTNGLEEPQCLFLDLGLGRGGELVYDFPTLNEELLAWGYTPFADVKVTKDEYNLKTRLLRAKTECERREKEREQRMKELEKKWRTRR